MCDQSSSIVQLQLSYLVSRSHLLVQIFQKRDTKVSLFDFGIWTVFDKHIGRPGQDTYVLETPIGVFNV